MAFFDYPQLGADLNGPLSQKFEELYALVTGGSTDPLISAESKGYIQRRNVMNSPIDSAIPNFVSRFRTKVGKAENQNDVNVVILGDSIITDMDYASELTDATFRPPFCTEKNLTYYLQEKLGWKEQQYRRFDAKADPPGGAAAATNNFIETGTAVTKTQDPLWDWVYATYPKPQVFYNGLTRVITANGAIKPSVNFYFRNSYRRCDFIYRTDSGSSEQLTVTVQGGNGYFTVYDDRVGSPTIGTWVEANNFVFSAKEDDTLHTEDLLSTGANGPSLGYKKTIFQKRLKFKRTLISESRSMTITAMDTGRLCYWGIQYSTNDNMINVINAGRGSHNLNRLKIFNDWAVDHWKPDLIILQCPVINEMTSAAGGVAVADSPATFAARFPPFINDLLAKPYHPEIIPLILFINGNQQPIDPTGRWLARTISGGLGNNAAIMPDYTDKLFQVLKEMVYPTLSPDPAHPNQGTKIVPISVFWEFIRYGIRRAKDTNNSVFAELFGYTSLSPLTALLGGPGTTGTSLVADITHLNDMGNFLAWRYLEKYFEF